MGFVRHIAVSLVFLIGGASCATDTIDDEVSVPAIAPDESRSDESTQTSALLGGSWESFVADFDVAGLSTSTEVGPPDVDAMIDIGGMFLAVGSFRARFTAWRSTDLRSFEAVYHDASENIVIQSVDAITEFKGQIVVAATGDDGQPSRTERSFLFVSDDGGKTWVQIDDPIFAEPNQRIDGVHVVSGAIVAAVVNDACCGGPVPMPHRSTDLSVWQPIELPDAIEDDWPTFLSEGTTLWAMARRRDRETDLPMTAVWRSIDGGATFEAMPLLDQPTGAWLPSTAVSSCGPGQTSLSRSPRARCLRARSPSTRRASGSALRPTRVSGATDVSGCIA